jgi:type IV pilus assembly protein PilW
MKGSQQGLSLVELMVAMAISSFLILGVTQIYIDNKRNYLFQQGQNGNMENSRFVGMLLEQELNRTGFRRRPDDKFDNAFPAATFGACSFSAGQTVTKIGDADICIRFQPSAPDEKYCNGNDIPGIPNDPYKLAANTAEQVVAERLRFNTDSGELQCIQENAGSGESPATSLVNGISRLRFEYGVSSPASTVVNNYVTDPGSNPIRAIRYSILASAGNLGDGTPQQAYVSWCQKWSPQPDDDDDATEPTDDFCEGYETDGVPPDKGLYQMVSGSVALRNMNP